MIEEFKNSIIQIFQGFNVKNLCGAKVQLFI